MPLDTLMKNSAPLFITSLLIGRRKSRVGSKMLLLVSAIASSLKCYHPSSSQYRCMASLSLVDAFQPLRNDGQIFTFTMNRSRRTTSVRRIQSSMTTQKAFQKLYSSTYPVTEVDSDDNLPSTTTTTTTTTTSSINNNVNVNNTVPLYRSEGLFAVHKPINWTSQDVVYRIRSILEDEAKERGANPARMTYRKRNKSRILKVGHGGTLDPLATGVLVIGVGTGTKRLNDYMSGSKKYRAVGRFGIETNTLDLDPMGIVTKEASWDHVTKEQLQTYALPKFVGKIQQTPPIFSARRQGGKRLYEAARQGLEVTVEPKNVEIHDLQLVSVDFPDFTIDMECGGGTFVRSLIRDVAYDLNTVATTAMIQRTKQGPFTLEDCLPEKDWNADSIYACIDEWNTKFAEAATTEDEHRTIQ